MGKWGGYHTEFAHLARGFAGNDRALAEASARRCSTPGLLAEKPSVGQRHVFLNPRRAATSRASSSAASAARSGLPRKTRYAAVSVRPVRQKLFTARTLAGRARAPTRPDRSPRPDALHAAGRRRGRATPLAASATRRDGARRRPRDAHVRRGPPRTNALAHALRARGVGEGDASRSCAATTAASSTRPSRCSKLGAHALYLNTAFAGPQITEVAEREQPTAIVYDASSRTSSATRAEGRKRFIAWHDAGEPGDDPRLEDLIAERRPADVEPPSAKGRVVILTSGTTGSPKGAQRRQPESLDPARALFA
jgi:YD repeat-containing protein